MTQAKPSKFETFEAGTYNATRITWFSRDSSGNPIFKAVGKSGWLVAQYRTSVGEKDGPPGSVTPDDLALFAYTFGCDISNLPTDRTAALIAVEEMIAAQTDISVPVYVGKKGWISNIPGMQLPEETYLFERDRIATRKNGVPEWYNGQWGDYIKVGLTVIALADGTETPFKGTSACQIWVMRKPKLVVRALLPTATAAILGPEEDELEHIDAALKEENTTSYIVGTICVAEGKTRPTIDPLSLRAVPKSGVIFRAAAPHTPANATAPKATTAAAYSPHVMVLREAVEKGCNQGVSPDPAFGADGKLTKSGRAWCGANLKPIATKMSLTTAFGDMDLETVQTYLAELGSWAAPYLARVMPAAAVEAPVVEDDFGDEEATSWD